MSEACWNGIGVRGDRSCEELVRHVHCRNCPVYSSAARALLDRACAPGDVAEWTSHFAQPKHDDREGRQPLMIFRADSEWLALAAHVIVEVADLRPIHALPHRRGGVVLGVANIRGELLICVSLARLLKCDAVSTSPPIGSAPALKRLLVVRLGELRFACPADEVHGLERVATRQLTPLPATVAKASVRHAKAVLSWNGHSVGVLDETLLSSTLSRSLA